jgi:hypothetical protein
MVIAIGNEVKNVQVGDRVSIEPGQSCWACGQCKSGRYNLCPDVKSVPWIESDCCWIGLRDANRHSHLGSERCTGSSERRLRMAPWRGISHTRRPSSSSKHLLLVRLSALTIGLPFSLELTYVTFLRTPLFYALHHSTPALRSQDPGDHVILDRRPRRTHLGRLGRYPTLGPRLRPTRLDLRSRPYRSQRPCHRESRRSLPHLGHRHCRAQTTSG